VKDGNAERVAFAPSLDLVLPLAWKWRENNKRLLLPKWIPVGTVTALE